MCIRSSQAVITFRLDSNSISKETEVVKEVLHHIKQVYFFKQTRKYEGIVWIAEQLKRVTVTPMCAVRLQRPGSMRDKLQLCAAPLCFIIYRALIYA